MEAQEAAGEEEGHRQKPKSLNRNHAAIAIAKLALLLSVTSLAGGNVSQDITNTNITVSDTWALGAGQSHQRGRQESDIRPGALPRRAARARPGAGAQL